MTISLAALITFLRHQRLIMDYMFISAVGVFIYDYLLMLHSEIKLIWFSRWSYTKFLFLALRYMSFAQIFLALHNQTFLNLTPEICNVTYPVKVWFTMLQMIFAEIILAIRTWAVWNRNKLVGVGLTALIIASLVLQCVVLNGFINSLRYASAPYRGFRGCFITYSDRVLWINFTLLTAVEATCLVLMTISAFRSYRQGNIGRFSLIVHRDGILYYIYLLCISLTNLVVTLALPHDMMTLTTLLQSNLYSMLAARIVLKIRDVTNHQDAHTELHTGYQESEPSDTPIRFSVRHRDIMSCTA